MFSQWYTTLRPALFRLRRSSVFAFLATLGAVAVATGLGLVLAPFLDPTNIALLYLVAVVMMAITFGLALSIICSVLSVLLLDALFVPPLGIFSISSVRDLLTLAIFLFVSFVISELGSQIRAQVRAARRMEREADALNELSREIAFVQDWDRLLTVAVARVSDVFRAEAAALLLDRQGQLQPVSPFELSDAERQDARRAFDRRETTGQPASAVPIPGPIFVPLQTAQGIFGVLALRLSPDGDGLSADQRRLLETIAGQVAIALEHAQLSAQAKQARQLEESDRFRNALLSSLSHDLRTPLASIIGSVTSLTDEHSRLSDASRRDLLETIQEEAARLDRLLGNLLNMTRLESGALKPQKDWHSLEEVIGAALAHSRLDGHEVHVELPEDLPLVPFDFVLIQQVLFNLIDNAAKFSPANSPIEVRASQEQNQVTVCVADRGIGIPPSEGDRVFDKFYRVPSESGAPGTGLGLSICKGIIEAHGGTIRAEPREGSGTCLIFCLPWSETASEA